MLREFVFTNLDVEVLAVSSSLATVSIPVSPILIARLPNCRVMLELYLLRTVTERCLSWLFPCIPSCVPCSLDSHHPQSKAVAVLTRLDGFQTWSWGLSLSWGSPGSSLAIHRLGFSPPPPTLVPLRSFKVVQLLSRSVTDKSYRDAWGWVQHHANPCCFQM